VSTDQLSSLDSAHAWLYKHTNVRWQKRWARRTEDGIGWVFFPGQRSVWHSVIIEVLPEVTDE